MRLVIPNEARSLPFEAKITLGALCDAHVCERSFASLRMTAHRLFGLSLVCFSLVALAASTVSQLPELRDLDLSGWDCLSGLEGIAKTQDGKERNQQKNRSPIELTGMNIPSFDTAAFLARVADYDRQIEKKHRRDLSPTQKEQVIALEKQIVSITGWLVLAYQGVPETTNCRSKDFLDWHLELSPEPADHPAQVGDPTPIICEITPRTQALIYRSGVQIQKLAAFLRRPAGSWREGLRKMLAHESRLLVS